MAVGAVDWYKNIRNTIYFYLLAITCLGKGKVPYTIWIRFHWLQCTFFIPLLYSANTNIWLCLHFGICKRLRIKNNNLIKSNLVFVNVTIQLAQYADSWTVKIYPPVIARDYCTIAAVDFYNSRITYCGSYIRVILE